MNDALAQLLLQFAARITDITKDLRDDALTTDEWEKEFLKLLAQYLMLAGMQGKQTTQLTISQQMLVVQVLREQTQYLNGFANDIKATGWQDKHLARAKLYAESIRRVYWSGVTECIDKIPVPGDSSTLCDGFCKCFVTIDWLNRDRCDCNVYWHRSAHESCATCVAREETWTPLKVRGGYITNG